ncbi:MAG: hypothetical protein PHE55_18110 [Methylococcaceae bacterium]|nr:hypothetical protein [Methylococcaceae bacterium]
MFRYSQVFKFRLDTCGLEAGVIWMELAESRSTGLKIISLLYLAAL